MFAARMTLASATFTDFTVFESARFNLCPGVNVLLGANATGKTHAMKAMYAGLTPRRPQNEVLDAFHFHTRFKRVFLPAGFDARRLVRHGRSAAVVTLQSGSRELELEFSATEPSLLTRRTLDPIDALYVPSREVLSMFEGFIAAYSNRELSFDETFFDLCVALSATPLRGERAEQARPLREQLERLLGGKVYLEGTRFYVQPAGGERVEAHLVAEGVRKLAALAHLVTNGSIAAGGVLFWDEPETNLNPRLITRLVDVLVELANHGVQIVLATHDYLLSHRLSLLAEYGRVGPAMVRFFGLSRDEEGGPVTVSSGDTLSGLADNPIVDEFVRHYDFERDLFDGRRGEGGA